MIRDYEKEFMALLAAEDWARAILHCRDTSEMSNWSGWHLERLYEAVKAVKAKETTE